MQTFIPCLLVTIKNLKSSRPPFFTVSSGPPVFEGGIRPFPWTKLASCPCFLDVRSIYAVFEYRLSLSAGQSLLFLVVQMGQLSTLKILFPSGLMTKVRQTNWAQDHSQISNFTWADGVQRSYSLSCSGAEQGLITISCECLTGQSADKVRKGQEVCHLH